MTNTKNLANLAAALDDATSGQVLQSTGSGGVTFAAASGGGGGGSMTVYNDLNGTDGTPSGYTYLTNASSPSNGDLAFVTANNTVYVRASSGWRKIATIQESPGTITGHSASYPSIGQNATTDITLSSTDPEGFDVTWSYAVGGNGTLSGSNINNSNGDTLASIAVQTANANSGGTNTITYRLTRETTTVAGDFTITFTATDSQSTGTSDTGAISFELAFIVADSHYTNLLMATDGSAGDNNDITDSSSSNHSITVNGDAHAGTFSPYRHGGYSTYFDGTDAYLSIAHSADLDLGIGDFTIEGWWRFDDTSNQNLVSKYAANAGFVVQYQSGNLRLILGLGASETVYSFSWTPVAGTWYHVCILRDGTNGKAFINGTQIGSTTTFSTSNVGTTGTLQIGLTHTVSEYTRGYVSDVRIVKGTAITPPSGGPTGRLTAVTNTSLLTCHLPYISDGSSNGHSITINGGIEAKPIGPYDYDQYSESVNGGSIHFDGTGDYLTVYDTGLSLGNNSAFTVEFWFLTSKNPDQIQDIWDTYSGSTAVLADEQIRFSYSNNTGGIYLYDRQNSNNILEVTNKKLGRNTWNHFCWTRDASNNHKFYINGEQIGTSTSSTSYDTNRMVFGVRQYASNIYLDGNISDFRLVKGTVVYSGEFTPPTGPLTTTGGTYSDTTNVNTSITASHTKLLISGTDAHVIDKSQSSNLKLVGNTAASTTQAKFSNTASVYFDGDADEIAYTVPTLSGDFTFEAFIYPESQIQSFPICFTSVWDATAGNRIVLSYDTATDVDKFSCRVGSNFIVPSSTSSTGQWYHVAVVRSSGSTVSMYIDGIRIGTQTYSGSISSRTGYIGGNISNSAGGAFKGYIQDFRFTNGLARYTAADESSNIPSGPLSA